MDKIVIFGNSGSGKSTLAGQLCARHGLAHFDLDTVAWTAQTPPQRRPREECSREIGAFVQQHEGWVIEGCYADLVELALPASTEIIFLDLPVQLCTDNARRRPWEPHKYASKEAQDANLDMLLDWIAQYEEREDTFSRASHAALFERYAGKKTRYTDNARGTGPA
ncbi:MAG: shikimate kinase [Halioglobus sp.]|nr:shikimate kinase [Halioglobus sp.]